MEPRRSWTKTVDTVARSVGGASIKTRLLVFALVATLLPSLALGWRSYVVNQQFVSEKLAGNLRTITSQTAREVDLWLKERVYEMRVFSTSYEVTENLEKLARGGPARTPEAQRRLAQFLGSVRTKFSDYEELLVVAPSGTVLASSGARPGALRLPSGWLKLATADRPILGEAYWDEERKKPVLAIAVPISVASGHLLGVLGGTVNFATVERMLASLDPGPDGHTYLVRRDGAIIVSSRATAAAGMSARLKAAPKLFESPEASLDFADYQGQRSGRPAHARLPDAVGRRRRSGTPGRLRDHHPDAKSHPGPHRRRAGGDRAHGLPAGPDHRAAAEPSDRSGGPGGERRSRSRPAHGEPRGSRAT